MIDCLKASELITAYVDGELCDTEVEALYAHLDACPDCRKKLDFEREAKEIVKLQHTPAESPKKVRRRIVEAIEDMSELGCEPSLRALSAAGRRWRKHAGQSQLAAVGQTNF